MKKILGSAVLFILFSCSGFDSEKCLASVVAEFPNDAIYGNPTSCYAFYVIRSNYIIKVETGNIANANVTQKVLLTQINLPKK